MILTHCLLQWDVSSFMTSHWNCSLKLKNIKNPVKSTIQYISIDQACKKFGSSLSNALPAFHALTGCEYKASFKRKRKVAHFRLLEQSTEAWEVFTEMITEILLNSSILERKGKYPCFLCGKKKCDSIDDVRLQMFLGKI